MISRFPIRYVAVLALAGAAILSYVLVQSGTARSAGSGQPNAEQAAISQLSVFQHAATPADSPPAGETTISGQVRRVGDPTSGHGVWASVSTDVCVQLAGGASACIETDKFANKPLIVGASSGGPGTTLAGSPPPPEELAGVVPDGIKSVTARFKDGTSETASVIDNGFYMHAGRAVKGFDWTTSDGVVHNTEEEG